MDIFGFLVLGIALLMTFMALLKALVTLFLVAAGNSSSETQPLECEMGTMCESFMLALCAWPWRLCSPPTGEASLYYFCLFGAALSILARLGKQYALHHHFHPLQRTAINVYYNYAMNLLIVYHSVSPDTALFMYVSWLCWLHLKYDGDVPKAGMPFVIQTMFRKLGIDFEIPISLNMLSHIPSIL
jgi:hypothetical protein